MTYTDFAFLARPIHDAESARHYLQSLVSARMSYHLEEPPASFYGVPHMGPRDCEGIRSFTDAQAALLESRAAELYALPSDVWGDCVCPIGYMMHCMAD